MNLNTSDLNNGLYLVRVYENTGNYYGGKLLIEH